MIKILIAEDEAGIRTSIANAFPWLEMGCELVGAADSGINALELCLQHVPDIIISDIVMPGIDGLTFLKYVREKYPATQFILLTGHRNFDYAKDALNLGAAVFLLKPIVYSELRDAINKLIDKIVSQQEARKTENQQEQVLRNLLAGRIYHRGSLMPQVKALLNDMLDFQVAVLRFDHDQDDSIRMQNLLLFCESLLSGPGILLVKADAEHLVFIFMLPTSENDNDGIRAFMIQVQQRVKETFHATVSVGVSSLHHGSDQLREAFVEGLRALGRKFFSGSGSTNFFLSAQVLADETITTDYQIITQGYREILDLVERPDSSQLNQQAGERFAVLIQPLGSQVDLLKSSFIAIAALAIKRVLKDDSRQLALLFDKYANFQKVIGCESLEELRDLFVNLVLDLSDYRSIKSCNRQTLLSKIFTYIHENYQNSITLNDIAKAVYLSPSYLSSIISNETGKGFTDILNEVRIQQAIELLKDPRRKIAEIAYTVGYNEPQYFTMIFKKHTDLTPRDYRELYCKPETGLTT